MKMDKYLHPSLYDGCYYLSILGFKLIHDSERGPRSFTYLMVHCIALWSLLITTAVISLDTLVTADNKAVFAHTTLGWPLKAEVVGVFVLTTWLAQLVVVFVHLVGTTLHGCN